LRVSALALGLTLLISYSNAWALLPNYCYVYQNSHPWFDPTNVVYVYINNSGSNNLFTATGMTQWDAEVALKRALYIWNEQAGASIKLRYVGTTPNTTVTGGIVVVGNSTACGVDDGGAPAAVTFGHHFDGWWLWSKVTIYKKKGNCQSVGWVNTPTGPAGSIDLVGVLVHEFGHAAFNMGHPYGSPPLYEYCSYTPGLVSGSVMQGASRDLSNWDLEVAQQRYNVRAQFGKFYGTFMSSPTSWFAPGGGSFGATPLYRMGSMGSRTNTRAMAWVDNGPGGAVLRDGGAGYYNSVAQYKHRALNSWYYLWPSAGRPVAMATQISTTFGLNPPIDMLVAYQKSPSTNIYSDANNAVCWRLSTNGGVTWGAESCSGNTNIYGITAGYDPDRNMFVIGWVKRDSTYYNRINIITVPATGSTTPGATTTLSISALHPPSIACTGAYGRCLLAYETANGNGSLGGTFIGINASGQVVTFQSYVWPFVLYDTPGLTYIPFGSGYVENDDTFRLAVTDSSNAVYSYKMSNSDPGLVWYGTGDIWNSANSQISTAVLTSRYMFTTRPEAWFVHYW
jgi:hypothetical protein